MNYFGKMRNGVVGHETAAQFAHLGVLRVKNCATLHEKEPHLYIQNSTQYYNEVIWTHCGQNSPRVRFQGRRVNFDQ